MTTGEAIKYLRHLKGISQDELASGINVTQASISYIECNKKIPHKSTVRKIESFLNIPPFIIPMVQYEVNPLHKAAFIEAKQIMLKIFLKRT